MALPLGKLTLLIGAGVVGSILAKEGRMPSFSDAMSGALKVALKPIKQSDSSSSSSKPRNDALLAQVNSLKQELQLLTSIRPVTIVTSRAAGGRRYGVVIVIVVLGYGYVWWKGWKLPDFMFATKRGLKDACESVSKELDKVYKSVKVTRNRLSSQLDQSSQKFDEIVECTSTTKEEVTLVRGKVSKFSMDLQSVNRQIRTLESKMGRIQEKQDETKEGVGRLLLSTLDADNRLNSLIQDSSSSASRPALEHSRVTTPSRPVSLPAALPLEASSSSASNGSSEVNGLSKNVISASSQGISGPVENASSLKVSNGHTSENIDRAPTPEPSPRQPVRIGGFLSRTFSVTQSLFK